MEHCKLVTINTIKSAFVTVQVNWTTGRRLIWTTGPIYTLSGGSKQTRDLMSWMFFSAFLRHLLNKKYVQ